MSKYISPYSLQLAGRSGLDRVAYRDYLQAQNLAEEVNYSIAESMRETIGTIEQLHERGYEMVTSAMSDLRGELAEGFEGVSWKLDDITGELTALNAKFDWGFGQMIAGIGRVNDSLQELTAIARTPAETWAYNQYEIARDAIRRKLYPEALEALQRAINGHGDNVGYKIEYRFHYTLGVLFLGDADNTDAAVLDLAKSEAAFLTAARYAKSDYPLEASVALTAAGWAAYCQGKLTEAEQHTQQAANLHPKNGEAFYQLSKIQMCAGKSKEAVPNLRRAAKLDPLFSVKAATDPDFLQYKEDLCLLIDSLRQEAMETASDKLASSEEALKRLEEWETEKVFPQEMKLLKNGISSAKSDWHANTFLGYLDSAATASRVATLAEQLLDKQKQYRRTELKEAASVLAKFATGFASRAALSKPKFQSASDLWTRVETQVQTPEAFAQGMELLRQSHELYTQLLNEYHSANHGIERRNKLMGQLVGGAIGMVIGIPLGIPMAMLGLAMLASSDFTRNSKSLDPTSMSMSTIIGIGVVLGAIGGGLIGATKKSRFTNMFSNRHSAKINALGVQPILFRIEGIVPRPERLFDEASLSDLKSPAKAAPRPLADTQSCAYSLILVSVPDDRKIAVIKELRMVQTGLGLADAKSIVENLPHTVLENVSKDQAEPARKKLVNAGAQVKMQSPQEVVPPKLVKIH